MPTTVKTPVKSKLRAGAKHLVSTAAAYHNMTSTQVLALQRYTRQGMLHQPLFFICAMMLIQRSVVESRTLLEVGLPENFHELIESNSDLTDYNLEYKFSSYDLAGSLYDNYEYLYNTIELVLNRKARSWRTLPDVIEKPKVKAKERSSTITVVEFPPSPPPRVIPEPSSTITVADLFSDTEDTPAIHRPAKKNLVWNTQQNEAFNMIFAWLRNPRRKQIFRLYGYAGTGKTEMSKFVANFVYEEGGNNNVPAGVVLYSAYTGKSCSVLRSKGCLNADTLHSLLYKVKINEDTGKIDGYVLNPNSPLRECPLVIVDEASFVNTEMGADLMSFGVPILLLGDPKQLPPVSGEGALTDEEPDYMLTDVRRQAKDNPIIYLATRAREEKIIHPGNYGESIVYPAGTHLENEMLFGYDQVLVGTNPTRKSLNRRMRRANGKADKDAFYPVKGDRLICLKNNRLTGLYNGTLWTSSQPIITKAMVPVSKGSSIRRPSNADVLAFKVRGIDEFDLATGKPIIVETQCSLHHFNEGIEPPEWRDIVGTDAFDFGYAITVHKAQGSQYDAPLLVDESASFRDMRHRHLYTGITRAAERIGIVLTA